jgi:signal transduction histidine kinase
MFVVLWSGFQLQKELLEEKQVLIFSGRSAQIEAYIGGIAFKTQQDVLSFRRDYLTLHEYDNNAIFQIMDAYLGSNPDINGISISFTNESTKSTDKLYQLQMHRNQDVLIREVFSDEEIHYTKASYVAPVNIETIFIWTSAYRDELRGDSYLISCSYPILKDKQVDAVVTFDVRLDKINNFVGGIAKQSPGSIILMTEDQYVIFNSGNTNIIATPENQRIIKAKVLDSLSSIKMNQQISEEKKTGDFSPKRLYLKRYDGADILVISRFVKEYRWRIFYAITAKHIYQLALKELYPALLLSIGILILLFFILTYIAHKITRPIVKLNRAMKVFSETGNKVEVITSLSDEVGELSREFTQMQDTIIQRNKDLEKLDVAKSNFLSLISHEIRTPLNGILGSAFFLKEQNADSEMTEFLEMLTDSAERLESLSKKALLITELQTSRGGQIRREMDIRKVIGEVLLENKEDLDKKNYTINFTFENETQEIIPDAFKTAVNEIIKNCIRFAFDNSLLVISVKDEGENWILSFTNQGDNIDGERLELLGKPFELGQSHYDKRTGLGLALVSTIMGIHGGAFKIENDGRNGVISSLIIPKSRL